jgi:hypothetical protein
MPSHRQEAPADRTQSTSWQTKHGFQLNHVGSSVGFSLYICILVSVNGGKDAVTQAGDTSRLHNPHPGKPIKSRW